MKKIYLIFTVIIFQSLLINDQSRLFIAGAGNVNVQNFPNEFSENRRLIMNIYHSLGLHLNPNKF